MATHKAASVAPTETAELRREFTGFRDQLERLIDVLDGIREELQWLTRNGLPVQEERVPASPVLKRMALNPLAADWNEQLEIVRGDDTGRGEGSDAEASGVGGSETAKEKAP